MRTHEYWIRRYYFIDTGRERAESTNVFFFSLPPRTRINAYSMDIETCCFFVVPLTIFQWNTQNILLKHTHSHFKSKRRKTACEDLKRRWFGCFVIYWYSEETKKSTCQPYIWDFSEVKTIAEKQMKWMNGQCRPKPTYTNKNFADKCERTGRDADRRKRKKERERGGDIMWG